MRSSEKFLNAVRGLFYAAAAKCYTVAADKTNAPGDIVSGGAGAVAAGQADGAKNILGMLQKPGGGTGNQATVSALMLYGEYVPTSAYTYAPIGSLFFKDTKISGAPTDADIYLKTVSGWEKVLLSSDATAGWLTSVTPASTTAATAWTAANFIAGLINHDPSGSDRSVATPNATALNAAMYSANANTTDYSSIRVVIRNTADADELITVTAAADITLSPTIIYIKPGVVKEFLYVVTSYANHTGTLYDLDSLRGRLEPYVTSYGTGGNKTWAAADVLTGIIARDPNGAGRSDTLPAAAAIYALLPDARSGASFSFDYINTSDAGVGETIKLIGGSGMTLSPTAIWIPAGGSKRLLCRFTNAGTACTVYDMSCNGADHIQYAPTLAAANASNTSITLTAAQVMNGIVFDTPASSSKTYTLDVAADIYALIPNAHAGSTVMFTLVNLQATTYTMTLAASATITNGGSAASLIVPVSGARTWLIVFTSGTAAVLYPMSFGA
jgi:hypothetical protein